MSLVNGSAPSPPRHQTYDLALHLSCADTACPPEVLSRIAAAACVSPEHLSTVTVHDSNPDLVDALCAYAFEFTAWHDSSIPQTVSYLRNQDPHDPDTSPQPSPTHSGLASSSSTASDSTTPSPTATAPDDDYSDTLNYMNSRRIWRQARFCLRKVKTPEFGFGFGECCVLWPPPQPVSAQAMAEKRVKELCEHDPKAGDTNIVLPQFAPEAEGQSCASPSANNQTELYIAQYFIGVPIMCNNGIWHNSMISVLSTGRPPIIRAFLDGVLKWNMLRIPYKVRARRPSNRRSKRSYISLSRFKLKQDCNGYWENERDRQSRDPESVILQDGMMNKILGDVRQFLHSETKDWYVRHGLPQRRSYLFYGEPGTGKTSTIRVMASEFRRKCCYLSMANNEFSNQDLADALERLPNNALLVIEDVDALFTNRNADTKYLSFSGLLNALDGMLSVDGVITVMTTNHIEKLDEGMLRAGRIDRRFYFGPPNRECIGLLFKSFYPEACEEHVRVFVEQVWRWGDKKTARNVATLQQIFIQRRCDGARECAWGVTKFFENYFPRGVDTGAEASEQGDENDEKEERALKKGEQQEQEAEQ